MRGDAFGRDTWPPLAGYECDGAPLDALDGMEGARLAAGAVATGTPPGYQPLAVAPLDAGWQELPPREGLAAGEGLHAATLGLFRHAGWRGGAGSGKAGGTVFSAGTTDWAQVLGNARDRRVERITRNVLYTLLH